MNNVDHTDVNSPARMNFHCSRCGDTCLSQAGKWVKNNVIVVATIVAVFLGLVLGFSVRMAHPSPDVILWISIWGELFMRMLRMIVLPLTVCCLVVGISSMDRTASGRLGLGTLIYIFLSHVISIIVGLVMVLTIKPGAGFHDEPPPGRKQHSSYSDVIADLLRNLIPENMIQTCIQTAYTSVSMENTYQSNMSSNSSNSGYMIGGLNDTYAVNLLDKDNMTVATEETRTLMYRDNMNIIGVVTLSMAFGVAISAAGEAGKPLYDVMVSIQNVVFIVMKVIIWSSPFGILSLLAGVICKTENMRSAIYSVGWLITCSTATCLFLTFVVSPLLYWAICRRNPVSFLFGITDAVLAGMAPPSSAAAMPHLLSGLPRKFDLDPRVVQFMIPITTTINRGGSISYVTITVLFCAQSYDLQLTAGEIIVFVLMLIIMAVAVSSVPSSSIILVILLCSAFDVPSEERIGLLLTVDWLLDRIRTGCNIVSHGVGCAILDKLCGRSLGHSDQSSDEKNQGEAQTTDLHDECAV